MTRRAGVSVDPAAFQAACDAASSWPLPGSGRTADRWRALSALAEDDLSLTRLVEAHADALAITAECGAAQVDSGRLALSGRRWGVWAAEAPSARADASQQSGRWSIHGEKAWCSGATVLTDALVTAWSGNERLLLAVELDHPSVRVAPPSWAAAGMRRADTRSVNFDHAPARLVAPADTYLTRPGFWLGAIGVAACWYGGAAAVACPLRRWVFDHPGDAHAAAALGGVDAGLGASRAALGAAAAAADERPEADHQRGALAVRGTVARTAVDIIGRVNRTLGPRPLATDEQHAERVADLEVYVLQDHGERDLAVLGALAARTQDWSL